MEAGSAAASARRGRGGGGGAGAAGRGRRARPPPPRVSRAAAAAVPGAVTAAGGSQRGEVLVEFQGVSKRFGAKHVLRDASFTIRRGEAVGIIGPSGTGKSTASALPSLPCPLPLPTRSPPTPGRPLKGPPCLHCPAALILLPRKQPSRQSIRPGGSGPDGVFPGIRVGPASHRGPAGARRGGDPGEGQPP